VPPPHGLSKTHAFSETALLPLKDAMPTPSPWEACLRNACASKPGSVGRRFTGLTVKISPLFAISPR
jgi:hypothetical protein